MNDNQIVEAVMVPDNLPAIADDSLVAVAAAAEKRIDAMVKIKRLALKMTNAADWTDQGGKPYMWASGAEKIGRLFGISWRIDEPSVEYEESGHYSITYKGYFTLAGVTVEAIGSRSSKDGFFKKYDYPNGTKTEMPPSAIDKGDVKKSAYTNLLGNGITRILGLRNLTWEDLDSAGITKDAVGKVAFKKNGKQDAGIASEGSATVTGSVVDVKQQTKKKDGSLMKSPLFIIHACDGEYKTFSATLAKTAKEAKDNGRQVTITFTAGKYGNDAENVVFTDDGPQEEREPGQEG
jgi:hypothetical protein